LKITKPPISTVGKAAAERVLGEGPGAIRATVAAAVMGTATAVLTYKLLRGDLLGSSKDD
jgi:hypothetical protein